MAGFSELIKNFDKTREYVRDFFIYGCKVRSDFDRKSVRTYDDEKRRVESWMQDYMRYDDSVRGRSVSISVDSCHISENPLYNAYYSRSFTDNDIRLHFLITDILQDGQSRTLKELVDTLNTEYSQLFDEQTVRNKLKEYVEIVKQKFDVIPYDATAAAFYAEVVAKCNKAGQPRPICDSQIAATAMANDLILVTRNTKNFEPIAKIAPLKLENWFEA